MRDSWWDYCCLLILAGIRTSPTFRHQVCSRGKLGILLLGHECFLATPDPPDNLFAIQHRQTGYALALDRRLLDAVFSPEFLDKHEHVLLVGPAGVGKSFLAQALGYSAVRAGHTVCFSHADDFFKAMAQARVDNS